MNKNVTFRMALGMTADYRTGARQIAEWKTRGERLKRCKGCGRIIDGVLKRGFCIWCTQMNKAAINELKNSENEARNERLAKQRAKAAKKRAMRKAREAAKEVA